MSNPIGPAVMKTKGGSSLHYATRLQILLGGQLTSGTKRLTATSKGFTYGYGIETKIKILKNHLDQPFNIVREDKMIATDLGFISPSDVEEYKKEHMGYIIKELTNMSKGSIEITEDDIEFGSVSEEEASEE